MIRAALRYGWMALLSVAAAQEPPKTSGTTAPVFGECRTGYWSSNRNLDDQAGAASSTCFASWKPVLNETVSFGFNARVNGAPTRMHTSRGRIREAYARVENGPLTAKLGRQVIAWGRSDRISPTDNLSPRDYTALVPDDDEQRQGLDAALVRYELSQTVSVVAVVGRFEENVLPTGQPPQALNALAIPSRPEYALKLDRNGSGIDWSLSYYDGFERTPRYRAMFPIAAVPGVSRSFEHNRTLGADVALPAGNWTFRGETAITLNTPACSGCGAETRKTSKLVLGIDRDLGEVVSASAQIYRVHRSHYSPPAVQAASLMPLFDGLDRLNSEFSKRDYGATGRVSSRFFNDRLKLELGVIYHQPEAAKSSLVIRPRMSFAVSDHVKIAAGADRFQGNAQSYFGVRKKNNLNFLEISLNLPF
jgi:hypothetical protein